MLGTADALDYRVAEAIGLPLTAVRALPNSELIEWSAYFDVTDALEEMHARAAAGRSMA